MNAGPSCAERALIDRHFAARGGPREESAMRTHLGGCAACQEHYERQLLLADLDPKAPPVQDRLAVALGFSRRQRDATPWFVGLSLGALATAAILLVARPRGGGVGGDEFVARGGGGPAPGPALQIYCTSCGRPPAPLGDTVPASVSLAFAYRNPTGWKRLMVLAVDDQRHVHWYHPDPQTSTTGIAIARSPGLRELPWEIDQSFRGRTVRILGLFADEALSVGRVEGLVDASGCASLRSLAATCIEKIVTVRGEPK